MFDPFGDVLEPCRFKLAGPALRIAAAGDETGALQYFDMFRNRRLAESERRGQFIDGGFAESQTRKHGAARRVGECQERVVEMIRGHTSPLSYITIQLYNG